MNNKKLWMLAVLAALLVLPCAVQAAGLGVRTNTSYHEISLSASTDTATLIDYLEDYLSSVMKSELMGALYLSEYTDNIETCNALLQTESDEETQKWLNIYNEVPANGTLSARELAVQSYRELFEANTELEFFLSKLTEYYNKDEALRAQILSGDYTPLEVDQMVSELTIIDREAEKYRMAALNKLTGESILKNGIEAVQNRLSVHDEANPYRLKVLAIEQLGGNLEKKKAAEISRAENGNGTDPQSHITVISKKQIGILLLDDTDIDEKEIPIADGIKGIEVTLTLENPSTHLPDPAKKITAVTDEDGLVVFTLGESLKPDEYNRIEVFLTIRDIATDREIKYQRKDFGFCSFEGGTDPLKIYGERDTGDPYLVSLQFEDIDMTVIGNSLHATLNDQYLYNIHGEVEMNGCTDKQLRVALVDCGAMTASNGDQKLVEALITPSGSHTFESKAKWLWKNAPATEKKVLRATHLLRLDTSVEKLGTTVPSNEVTETWPSWRNIESDSVYEELVSSLESGDSSGTYLDAFVGGVGFKLPSAMPVVGGSEISMDNLTELPAFKDNPVLSKVKIQLDLPKTLLIAINSTIVDPKDNGRVYTTKAQQAIEQRQKDNNAKGANTKSLLDQGIKDAVTGNANGKWAGSFSFALSPFLQGQFTGMLDDDSFVFSGDIFAGLIFDISFDMTYYPCAAVYANFNALFRIKAGLDFGAEFEWTRDTRSFEGVSWSGASGFRVNLHIEFTLSAGAGVKGVCSFGIRGAFWVEASIRFTPEEGDMNPDYKIGARAELYFEMFFYKWSSVIIEWHKPDNLEAEDVRALMRTMVEEDGGNVGANLPHYGLKVIQTKHSLLGFWINRNATPNRLEMYTIDYVDGLPHEYNEEVIYQVEYGNYLYEFDVSYDPYLVYGGYGSEAIHYVVTEGSWEGGVVIGGTETDYWKQHAAEEIDALYHTAYQHRSGKTTVGMIRLHYGKQTEDHWDRGYINNELRGTLDNALFSPSVQTIHDTQSLGTGQRRDAFSTIGGIIFTDANHFQLWQYPIRRDKNIGSAMVYESGFSGSDEIPGYLILGDVVTTWATENTWYGFSPVLLQHIRDGESSLRLYYPKYDTGTISHVMDIETNGKRIIALSEPYYHETYNSPLFMVEKTLKFLLVDGEEVEDTADQSISGTSNSISVLTFDIPPMLQDDADPYKHPEDEITYQIFDYDIPGSGGNVDVMPMEWQDTIYFYWFIHKPGYHDPDKPAVEIMASMYDPDRNLVSPPFKMAGLTDGQEAEGKKFYCLRNEKGVAHLTAAYNTTSTGITKKVVTLPTSPSIYAFAPEFAAVGQGKDFNVYARIKNDGAFVLQEMQYLVTAQSENGGGQITLQNGVIDLAYPEKNRITHYDYLQQDYPRLKGMSPDEMDAELAMMNGAADRYTTVGEHAVYRVPDNYDYFNGNLVHTVTTGLTEDGEMKTVGNTTENYFFMPGNVATYKFSISGSATASFEGKYYLTMQMRSYKFTFGMNHDGPMYEAVLCSDGSRYDYYRLNENGERIKQLRSDEPDGVLGMFSSALPSVPVETSWVAENNGLNTARNDMLAYGNVRHLTMEQNDFDLSVRQYSRRGVDFADFTLRNNAPEVAPDMTPKLIAKARWQGKEIPTGWSMTLDASNIKDGFSRSVTIPLKDIVNGKSYEELTVYLVTTASDNPNDFMDQNAYNNKVMLNTTPPFRILRQPDNVTAPEYTDASFTVQVEAGNICQYQWVMVLPNKAEKVLDGENQPTLTIPSVQMYQSGYAFCCLITAPDGRTIRTDKAYLTVVPNQKTVPQTGDRMHSYPLIALATASLALCAAVLLQRKVRKAKN